MQVQNRRLVKPDGLMLCSRSVDILRRTVLLHDTQELDDDFRARSDEALTLASFLGVVDVLESVVQDGGADHGCGRSV